MSKKCADAPGREALARLGRLARQQHEQVGEMPVVLHLIVRPAADRVAEIDEKLQQQRHRIGLGLRRERVYDLAGEAVIGGGAEHRPALCRRCCRVAAGRRVTGIAVEALPALFPPAVLPPSLPLTFAVVSLAPSEAVFSTASGSNSSAVNPFMMRAPRLSRTMSLKSVPGRSGISRAHAASGLKPASLACVRSRLAHAEDVVVGEHDQPLDAVDDGKPRQRAVRQHGPGRPQRFAAIGQPGGGGEHRLQPFADHELLVGRPQLHDAGRAEHHAIDLLGIGGQRDAVNAGRLAADGIAHQRDQAGVPGAGAKRAIRDGSARRAR